MERKLILDEREDLVSLLGIARRWGRYVDLLSIGLLHATRCSCVSMFWKLVVRLPFLMGRFAKRSFICDLLNRMTGISL